MTNLVENNTYRGDSQEAIDALRDIEKSYDIELAAKDCKDIFNPEFQVPDNIKYAACDLHIRTLQKMWLPEEYTQRQAELYAKALECFDRARSSQSKAAINEFNARGQAFIKQYDQELLEDPLAQMIRDEVERDLYDKIDDDNKEEFARTIGLEITQEITEEVAPQEVAISPTQHLGHRVVSGLVSLKSVFAK